jgi:hypothetical protein
MAECNEVLSCAWQKAKQSIAGTETAENCTGTRRRKEPERTASTEPEQDRMPAGNWTTAGRERPKHGKAGFRKRRTELDERPDTYQFSS